jgi:hypothetical protein
MLQLNEQDPSRIVIDHDNRLTMINTMLLEPSAYPYILLSQCERPFIHRCQVKWVGHMLLDMIQKEVL